MGLHYKFWGRKYNTAELTFQGSCCLGHSQMQGIKCCDAWPRKLPTDWLAPEQYLLLDQNKQKLDASYQPHIISETSTWPLGGLLRWKVSIPQDHTCQQKERMQQRHSLSEGVWLLNTWSLSCKRIWKKWVQYRKTQRERDTRLMSVSPPYPPHLPFCPLWI